MTLANRLTVVRVFLAIAVFMALRRPDPFFHLSAFFLFLAAILTDWIDGYVARKTHSISPFGKVLDPIADKILVLGTLLALVRIEDIHIPLWGVFLIISRELLIGGLRILEGAEGRIHAAEPWGKWKMGIQSVAILLMIGLLALRERISPEAWPLWLNSAPYYLTVLCAAAAWSSAWFYYRQSRKMLERSWS